MATNFLFYLTITSVLVSRSHAASACAPDCSTASEGDKVAVPWDCTQWVECSDILGTGLMSPSDPVDCLPGQYFNDFIVVPQCVPIPSDNEGFCNNWCSPCDVMYSHPGDVTPDPTNCGQFYVSLEGGVLLPSPCVDGPYYDYRTGFCQRDPAMCYEFCDECYEYCTVMGNVADPMDCCQ